MAARIRSAAIRMGRRAAWSTKSPAVRPTSSIGPLTRAASRPSWAGVAARADTVWADQRRRKSPWRQSGLLEVMGEVRKRLARPSGRKAAAAARPAGAQVNGYVLKAAAPLTAALVPTRVLQVKLGRRRGASL